MKTVLLIVFFACLGYVSLADVLLPTTLAQCQACCDIVAFRSEFDSFSFSISVCKGDGCNRLVSLDNLLCEDLYSLNTNNRRACELGRDFRFNGYTSLLTSESDLRRCPSLPGEEHFLTDKLLIPHTLPAVVTPFAVTRAACSGCCEDIRVAADNGNNGNPDDFETASCQNTCNKNPVVPCFAENSHNIRSGCLLAMDFLLQGRGTLDVTRGAFTCDASGGALIPGTSFPTLFPTTSPTKNPTKKPTFAPTKSPHAEPTTAPTKLSTFQPTRSPLIQAQPINPQSPSNIIIYAAAGAGGFGVMISCCLLFFILGRRSALKRSNAEALKSAFREERELKKTAGNSTRPIAAGSFDVANLGADVELSESGSRSVSDYHSASLPSPIIATALPKPPISDFAPPGLGFRPESLAVDFAAPKLPVRQNVNPKDKTMRYQFQSVALNDGRQTVADSVEVEVDESKLDPAFQLGTEAKNLRPYFEYPGAVSFTFGRKVVKRTNTPTIRLNTLDGDEPLPPELLPRKESSILRLAEEEQSPDTPERKISF